MQAPSGATLSIPGEFVIGRSRNVDLVLDDDSVSSRHARVTIGVSGTFIEDLGSTNGTVVNGVRTAGSVELHPGDRVRLGETDLVVEQA